MMRAAALLVILASCAVPAQPVPLVPEAGFLPVVRASIAELEREAGGHPVQVDPRPLNVGALSSFEDGLADAGAVRAARTFALTRAGIESGDIVEAEECAHVGGMGGLMIEPLTTEQRRLLERCGKAFRGFTVAVSLPMETAGAIAYRVLAFGSDAALALDVTVSRAGEVVEVRRLWYFVS